MLSSSVEHDDEDDRRRTEAAAAAMAASSTEPFSILTRREIPSKMIEYCIKLLYYLFIRLFTITNSQRIEQNVSYNKIVILFFIFFVFLLLQILLLSKVFALDEYHTNDFLSLCPHWHWSVLCAVRVCTAVRCVCVRVRSLPHRTVR